MSHVETVVEFQMFHRPGNKIWKDWWEFVSQEAGSDDFHLVMRHGFCTEPFAGSE